MSWEQQKLAKIGEVVTVMTPTTGSTPRCSSTFVSGGSPAVLGVGWRYSLGDSPTTLRGSRNIDLDTQARQEAAIISRIIKAMIAMQKVSPTGALYLDRLQAAGDAIRNAPRSEEERTWLVFQAVAARTELMATVADYREWSLFADAVSPDQPIAVPSRFLDQGGAIDTFSVSQRDARISRALGDLLRDK